MKKVLILAVLWLCAWAVAGCYPPAEVCQYCQPAGSAAAPSALIAPPAEERYFGIVTGAPESAAAKDVTLYPISGAPEIRLEEVDALLSDSDFAGTIRFALARVIDEEALFEPPAFDPAAPVDWQALIPLQPGESAPNIVAWQSLSLIRQADGSVISSQAENPISQVIPFAGDVQALVDARLENNLWVDFVLVERTGDPGAGWVLYTFAVPDSAAPGDKQITFCCQWLGCANATGVWIHSCRFLSCGGICQ